MNFTLVDFDKNSVKYKLYVISREKGAFLRSEAKRLGGENNRYLSPNPV
jgi:hypothetical protein